MFKYFGRLGEDVAGLLLLGAALFVGLSLASFSLMDPSLNNIVSHLKSQNLGGILGSTLADLAYQCFGVMAWALPTIMLYKGVQKLRRKESKPADAVMGLLVVWLVCSLVALHAPERMIYDTLAAGGLLGRLTVSGLTLALNKTGSAICLWTLFAVSFVLIVKQSVDTMFGASVKKLAPIANQAMEASSAATLRLKQGLESFADAFPAQEPALAGPTPREEPISSRMAEILKSLKPHKAQVIKEAPSQEAPAAALATTETTAEDESQDESDFEPSGDDPEQLGSIRIEKRKDDPRNKPKAVRLSRRIANWELPKLDLLQSPPAHRPGVDKKIIERNVKTLTEKLAQFSVRGEVVAVKPGPAVTMYEFKPAADVKLSKITELADDLALALSAESLRIIAPLPGRDVVGIESSNATRETVFLRETLEEPRFWDQALKLPIALGKQADGAPRVEDLRKMPHLLVAGSTGSGKSVFVLSLITSLIFRHSPKTLRLILVDPKQVDLAVFHKIPHLLIPLVKEAKPAVGALKWAIREMEKRYRSLSKFDARGLESYNEAIAKLSPDQVEQHRATNEVFEQDHKLEGYYYQELPYIVIVVEEFGDLMTVDKVNVEQAVLRLAQKARACGIHLILATQSPRKDVVTGLIKTNIPGRISFKVASKTDSRIIMDDGGAERLLPGGDMLFLAPGVGKPQRHHGAWIPDAEVAAVAKFWSDQGEPEYDTSALRSAQNVERDVSSSDSGSDEESDEFDEKYDEILAWVATQKEASASLLQRRFHLGYPRAARMIEVFEKEGVVGPANGSKPRQVLVNKL
jgi:S-DNA-T family DNA segregation ATPase FtsK/SpoIIIE